MLKIVTVPNNVLTTQVKQVVKIDEKIKKLAREMEKVLSSQVEPEGVGLAGPQVGESLAIFIMKPHKKQKAQILINPKIVEVQTSSAKPKTAKKHKTPLEGCLSIPRIWGPIKRAKSLLVEYRDLAGNLKKETFKGLEAMIVQHEIDHLNGVLFTQRALEQNGQLYEEKEGKLKRLKY